MPIFVIGDGMIDINNYGYITTCKSGEISERFIIEKQEILPGGALNVLDCVLQLFDLNKVPRNAFGFIMQPNDITDTEIKYTNSTYCSNLQSYITNKMRYYNIKTNKLLIRIDKNVKETPPIEYICSRIKHHCKDSQNACIILADYGYGMITKELIDACLNVIPDINIILDTKYIDYIYYKNLIVRINIKEFHELFMINMHKKRKMWPISKLTDKVLCESKAKAIIVTDNEYIHMFNDNNYTCFFNDAYDYDIYAIGAGDSFCAGLAYSLSVNNKCINDAVKEAMHVATRYSINNRKL